MSTITVWRDKPGATVATYAKEGSRIPLVLAKNGTGPSFATAEADELRTLVAGRNVFAPVNITLETAEEVLGWKVETE